jgi:hypothetical protein
MIRGLLGHLGLGDGMLDEPASGDFVDLESFCCCVCVNNVLLYAGSVAR